MNRLVVALAYALALAGCSAPSDAEIDMIEIHASGWVGYNIIVRPDGSGLFESGYGAEAIKRSFRLEPGQYERLASDIRPWLREARPVTEADMRRIVEFGDCPHRIDLIDAGAFYLHWQGPKLDVYRLVELGCDSKRNAVRYRELEEAVARLPIKSFVNAASRRFG
jgi:hypothetical protein